MNAFLTLTHRSIEHTDPEAAGFTDGWWWSITADAGDFESGAPSEEAAERSARGYIERSYGPGVEVEVFRGETLMNREQDEARVITAVAKWRRSLTAQS